MMNTIIHRLATLTVADVMSDKVVTVSRADTMSDAAQLMTFHNVHGLAVADKMGKCLGVLSSSDFVLRSKQRNAAHERTDSVRHIETHI